MTTLANRRRPATYDGVMGNDANVKIIQDNLALPVDKRPRVFFLEGAPGSGKTTLARIAAASIVTEPKTDIVEINGANENKVDDIRDLLERVQFLPMSGGARAIIIDECHRLTSDAFGALLKPLEDGAGHNYWFLATSESKKIPPAIRRRAKCIEVKGLDNRTMTRMLVRTAKDEGIQLPEAVRTRIIELAAGSPGQALSYLETVAPLCIGELDAEGLKEVLSTLKESDEGSKNLAKALLDGADLDQIIKILKSCQDAKEDPESLRRGVLGYASAALLNGWDKNARAVGILQVFSAGTTYDSGFPCLVAMAMTAGNM